MKVKAKKIAASELLASVKVGDYVTILVPNGIGRNGQEWKPKTGRCVIVPNPILDMGRPCSVVLDMGGRYGTPGVADEQNIVRIGQRIATPEIVDQPRE